MAVRNTGEQTFFGKGVSRALDIPVVFSVLHSRISWFVDIESHGSDQLPTYITLHGVPRGHLKHQVRFSNWDVFSTAIQEGLGSVLCYDDFVSTMARTRKTSTKTFIYPSHTMSPTQSLKGFGPYADEQKEERAKLWSLRTFEHPEACRSVFSATCENCLSLSGHSSAQSWTPGSRLPDYGAWSKLFAHHRRVSTHLIRFPCAIRSQS